MRLLSTSGLPATLLLLASAGNAATISSTTAPAVIHIGDTVTVAAVVRPSDGVVTPIYPEKVGPFEVLNVVRQDTLGGASIEIHLTTFETGPITVPPFGIAIDAAGRVDSVFTSPYLISVESLLPADSTAADTATFLAAHPPIDVPQQFLWKVALGYAAVLVALAALAFWVTKRLRRPRKEIPSFETKAPARPPDIVAYETLDAIESKGYIARGLWKPYFTEVTDAVRTYIEGRFRIETLDRTTPELLRDLESTRVEEVNRRRLAGMLEEADLVKFAKYTPDAASADRYMEKARSWIRDTTVTPVFGESPTATPAARAENS